MPGLSAGALAPAEAAGLIRVDTSGAALQSSPRPRRCLPRGPVRRARRGAPADRGRAPRPARPLRLAPGCRRRWDLTSGWPRCSRIRPPRRSGGVAPPPPRGRSNAPPSSARAGTTRPGGCSPPPPWPSTRAGGLGAGTGRPGAAVTPTRSCASPPGCTRLGARLVEPARRRARRAALGYGGGFGALPDIAWDAIGLAATVAYQTGTRPAARRADAWTAWKSGCRAAGPATPTAARVATSAHGPFGNRAEPSPTCAGGRRRRRQIGPLGAAAWLLDETELAVRLLRDALGRLRAAGVGGRSGAALSALEWACIDGGRWDEALAAAREARDAAAAYTMETVAASADLATATVLAMRGDHDQVRPRAGQRARRRQSGRVPRVRCPRPPCGGPRGARRGQFCHRLRTARPALRR